MGRRSPRQVVFKRHLGCDCTPALTGLGIIPQPSEKCKPLRAKAIRCKRGELVVN